MLRELTGEELWGYVEAQRRREAERLEAFRDVLAAQLATFLSELLTYQGFFHFDTEGRDVWTHSVPSPKTFFEAWTGRASPGATDKELDPFGGLYDPELLCAGEHPAERAALRIYQDETYDADDDNHP